MSDDLIADHAAQRGPSEWALAERRFADAWGHEPDLADPYDRQLLLSLLRDEVARAHEAELAAAIARRTERLREMGL